MANFDKICLQEKKYNIKGWLDNDDANDLWVWLWAITKSATLQRLSESWSKVSTVRAPGGLLQAVSTNCSVSLSARCWATSKPAGVLNPGTPNNPCANIARTMPCQKSVANSSVFEADHYNNPKWHIYKRASIFLVNTIMGDFDNEDI